MPAGLTVINDNGKYQIDELTYSLSVLAYGGYNSLTNGLIQTTAPNPMFAVYVPFDSGYVGGVGDVSLSGGIWSAQFRLFGRPNTSLSTSNIKWFVLGRPTPSGSGAGMEIYDASGNLKYSTAVKTKTISGTYGYVINPAKRYAFVGGRVGDRTIIDYNLLTNMTWQTYTAIFGQGYQCSSGGVWEDEVLYFEQTVNGGGGGTSGETLSGNLAPLLAIDVTEYT